MRAWQLDHSAGASSLLMEKIPEPKPGQGEILVRVCAAGVTPAELSWHPTTHTKTGQKRDHAIPGHEFSGAIAALGVNTPDAMVGQEIYGMNDWFDQGATAEFCITRPEYVAPKPSHLTHAQAAGVPIGALTAWQGMFDRAKLQKGECILIHGGSGGVGTFAVQLAHRHGAHVITTASGRNAEFLRQLGAQSVIDYRAAHFEDIVKNVDVVFDTVGGETLLRSWRVLAPGGRLVTIASGESDSSDQKIKNAFFIVEPNQSQLSNIAAMLDAGEILPVVDATVPFAQAPAAYTGKVQHRLGRGKIVVAITE